MLSIHSRKSTRSPTPNTSPRKVRRTATFEGAMNASPSTEGRAKVEDDGTATTQESTIPLPPLLKIPDELAVMIVKSLSPVDLRSFRQTCQWADSQAYDLFAERTFTHIVARNGHDSARRLAQVFQGYKGFAGGVQIFTVVNGSIYRPRPCHKDGQDMWTLSGVISTLRNLQQLELRDVTSQAVACHFRRQHVPTNEVCSSQIGHPDQLIYTTPGTDWPQPTTLWITSAQLTKQDITYLVRLAGPGLRHLKLREIKCTEGKWRDILQDLLTTSTGLERLELQYLSDATGSRVHGFGNLSLEGWERFATTNIHKAIRGPKGIEVVVVHQFDAYMTGSQAVKFGLEKISARLAGPHGVGLHLLTFTVRYLPSLCSSESMSRLTTSATMVFKLSPLQTPCTQYLIGIYTTSLYMNTASSSANSYLTQNYQYLTGSTMAASPLLQTPTDVMFEIFDLLTIFDICNFRQTCRWARDQSFKSFATRDYKNLHVCECDDSASTLAKLIEGNKDLAVCVKSLTVRCGHHFCKRRTPRTPVYTLPYQKRINWTVSGIMAGLQGIERVELRGLTEGSVPHHFHCHDVDNVTKLSHVPNGNVEANTTTIFCRQPKLATVTLRSSSLGRAEILEIFQLAGGGVTSIHMAWVTCTDGQWVNILRTIQAAGLDKLQLQGLSDGTRRDCEGHGSGPAVLTFQDAGVKLHQAVRGAKGIETLTVQQNEASMQGKQAVKIGLEAILRHFAAQEGL
ncbi:hypothetical protein LTR56_019719 [Elasticomyces elasticus]|nr:hypothetical protein LTR56_019719 [Elasticomyces elasticus]KAK4925873.1 hypothetical protein LTR49_007250 [Elasticomyces elasticus]KAK5764828.1 hypothetical protein LTS12_005098 [Elasticomyces elasticus]